MPHKEDGYQFKFVLIRYVPDFVKEEFFNVGIILYDMTGQKIIGKVAEKPIGLRCYGKENYKYLLKYADTLIKNMQQAAAGAGDNAALKDMLDTAFVAGTVQESGLLSFSNVKGGLTDDIEQEFKRLYDRFITEDCAEDKSRLEKQKRDLSVVKVYEILEGLKGRLKKWPTERVFEHPLIEGGYKFEVSFNNTDNLHLKVLSIRSKQNRAHELQNILSAIPILTDLKKQYKGHTFGGLIYFSPKYNKEAQAAEFGRLKRRFTEDGLDCVGADESGITSYLRNRRLL